MARALRFSVSTALLVAAASNAVGCGTEPTPPARARMLAAAGPSLTQAPAGAPRLFPNSLKYRDLGSKPAKGKVGNASIEARALLGKDAATIVEVSTRVLDDAAAAPGEVTKVQVKLFAREGAKERTANYHDLAGGGYWTGTFGGLARDALVEVKAHVTAPDAARTEVVTAATPVKLRPDIVGVSLSGPPRAMVGTLVDFAALIVEQNGDVGARTSCVFFVDDEEVARGDDIWVDAGSSVSCSARMSFGAAGTKRVRVDLAAVTPADWDDANNSASTTIEVVSGGPLSTISDVSRRVFEASYRYSESSGLEDYYTAAADGHWDEIFGNLYAWTTSTLRFPLASFALTMSRDGIVMRSREATGVDAHRDDNVGAWCTDTWAAGVTLAACAYDWGHTDLRGTVYGGHATYFISGWNAWNGHWSSNVDETYGIGTFELGNRVKFEMRVTDGTGATYTGSSEMTIRSEPWAYGWDYCFDDAARGLRVCTAGTQNGTHWFGVPVSNSNP